MSEQDLKTIGAVAAEVGLDRWRLAYLIERGTVPEASVKVPGRRLFTPGDIKAIEDALASLRAQEQEEPSSSYGGDVEYDQ